MKSGVRPSLVVALVAFALGARPAAAAAAAQASAAAPAQPLLEYLEQSVAWYRQVAQARIGARAADAPLSGDERETAGEVLRLSFEFARAAAALQPQPAGPQPQGSAMLARIASDAQARVGVEQEELARLQGELARAQPRERATLEQQIAEARSELSLAQARLDTARTVSGFVSQTGATAPDAGLAAAIAQLERSTPELRARGSAPQAPAPAARAAPSGVLALAGDLLSLSRTLRDLRLALAATARLRATADKLHAPLVADLQATLQQGDQLSQAPQTSDRALLQQRTQAVDDVTARFKRVSAAAVPLEKQGVLLDGVRTELGERQTGLDRQYDAELRTLFLHALVLGLGIALFLAASELWRRATFRYVTDVRRRQQFLLLRRVVVTTAVFLFVALALVTEVGSLATFAGFISAGLAVALQNVILSVAAYFFLIGKYGVRVGDRVQISGVNGDVIDIGLVRLHLMELSADGHPTGRVVVFSNAVLFQPNSNFFKQIPGSNFGWRKVELSLAPGSDYRLAEARVLKSVEKVYQGYRDAIDRQHQRLSQNLLVPMSELRPQSRLQLGGGGVEMIIRYPVPLDRAAAIDDEITRAVLEAIEHDPGLSLIGAGKPMQVGSGAPAGGHA